MYDETFAHQRRRSAVQPGDGSRCVLCRHLDVDTASDYEWPCLILKDWICETHCCEIQLPSHSETRNQAAKWKNVSDPVSLLGECAKCPYGDRRP